MLLDPILPEKGLAMLYAARGTGKTHVALGIGFAVATGTKFLNWSAPKPRCVLLIDGEMPAASLQERLASIVASAPSVDLDPTNIRILAGDLVEAGGIGNLASLEVQNELDQWLDGVDVVILDNLSSLTAVIRDNDAESWGPIQQWLLKLRRRGLSVLIVHHAGKGGEQRGTSRREDVLDTSISLRHSAVLRTLAQSSMTECGASMGRVKIPYYVVIKGRGYWRPHPRMRAVGFQIIRCGADGPEAWAIAAEWNNRWQAVRKGNAPALVDLAKLPRDQAEAVRYYPPGSVGAAFQVYIRTAEWAGRAFLTRDKIWWPAWFRIRDMWGDVAPDTITFEMMSRWRAGLEKKHGLGVAHKTLRVWRTFWKIMLGMRIARTADPSMGIRNRAPAPRWQRWSEGETVRLVKSAWRQGTIWPAFSTGSPRAQLFPHAAM